MSLPQSIPSKVTTDTSEIKAPALTVPTQKQEYLYITAILIAGVPQIDGVALGAAGGPVSFSSPIQCKAFKPDKARQIAYYQQ